LSGLEKISYSEDWAWEAGV